MEETYYELLKIDSKTSVADVVAAYHRAKSAYSKESPATYSLLGADEIQAIQKKLDEAYSVLTNVNKRVEYDRLLMERSQPQRPSQSGAGYAPADPASASQLPRPPAVASTLTLETVTGATLRAQREKSGYSIVEVANITKIQKTYLLCIEADQLSKLPPRVYIQGFIKTLAGLYHLSTAETSRQYLEHYDSLKAP